MKKQALIIFIFAFCILLVGCTGKNLPDDLFIDVENITNVPAGEFYLPYKINNFQKYEKEYNLKVSVNAYIMPQNKPLEVRNNRSILVAEDGLYAIVVRVSGLVGKEKRELLKEFSVEAKKSSKRVVFRHENDDKILKQFIIPYGGYINIEDVPAVPDLYISKEGFHTEILSKKWVVYDNDQKATELNQEILTNIKEDIPVYSKYEYKQTAIIYTVKYDTRGGTKIDEVKAKYNDNVPMPQNPKKEGYTFLGWYKDKECLSPFDWALKPIVEEGKILYAKWAKNPTNPTSFEYFECYTKDEKGVELVDEYGNKYCGIKVKNNANLPSNIVLPNNYNGVPIRKIEENNFNNSLINSIFIPSTYKFLGARLFENCQKLQSVEFEKGSEIVKLPMKIFFNCEKLERVVLPDRLVTIQPNAFENCLSLANIVLPKTLQLVNMSVFQNCKSLQSIVIPDEVKEIMKSAFQNCENLQTVSISENSCLVALGKDIFVGTQVTTLKLPKILEEKEYNFDNITITYYPPKEEKK